MEHAKAKSHDDMHNTSTVPCEKSKIVFFDSSIMKSIAVCPARSSRFAVKLICCIAFASASSACYLLESIAIILK